MILFFQFTCAITQSEQLITSIKVHSSPAH